MNEQLKTIGILTSGGDAPGMNAAVRAVVRAAISHGMAVKGVIRGYSGLVKKNVIDMGMRDVSGIVQRGGTVLFSSRCPEFKTEEGMKKALRTLRSEKIDGLVVIGGDGSFRGATELSARGFPCIGIPGTIDNDIGCSDYSIGFDTAANTAAELVDKLRDTSQSHDRCSVVEVMGHGCGNLALHAGIAAGATTIIVPEVKFDFKKDILQRFNKTKRTGKQHYIVVTSEGSLDSVQLTKDIQEATGIESRLTVLGYVQRGGNPSVYDRVMASRMGDHAVQLLTKGIGDRVVVFRDNKICDFDIQEALQMTKPFDLGLYEMARRINI